MEEVTKVIEDVDKLFSEIVVNGETHVSERYIPPASTPSQSLPQNQNDSQEDNNEDELAQAVEGEYVDTLNLNGVDHDFRDTPLTALVAQLQQLLNTLQTRINNLGADIGTINSKIPAEASTANKLADKNYVGNLISIINALIPAQATPQNQLADKNFVNSSIATNTANFLGTYSTLAEIEAIPNPTNNDYAFLETADASGNNVYDRYKYSAEDGEWLFEYELNNSSFTAEQWATINSGISQVSDTVQSGDNDPVSSDAVYQAIQSAVSPVDVVQSGNMRAVTSNAVAGAISSEATARDLAITNAINGLDTSLIGGNGKYIKSIEETDGVITAVAGTLSLDVLNITRPVGSTYTQYPMQKSPMELWGTISTWEVINYGGAFFRAEGGNAMTFDDNVKAITAVSGNTITIASHGASVGTVIFDFAIENGVVIRNESRVVTAVSGNVLTLNSQFTSTILRNVLIGQSSQNRYHNHSMSHTHSYGTGYMGSWEAGSGDYPQVGDVHRTPSPNHWATTGGASNSNTSYNGNSTIQEARSENFTYKVWLRVA